MVFSVIYATTSADISQTYIFRTYSSRGSSLNPAIVEAICATISIPSHFSPLTIRERLVQRQFVGGPRGVNNPARELIREAGMAFGNDKRVAQIISIGCGISPTLSLDMKGNGAEVGQAMKEMAADCQMVARELEMRLFDVEAYCRFNVEKGMKDVELDNWGILGDIEARTRSYIETNIVTKALDISLGCLRGRVGSTTLGRLSKSHVGQLLIEALTITDPHTDQSSSIKVTAKMAPPVSPFYVLRTKPWEILVSRLVTSPPSRQVIFPITGMGGCGKTQLVSHFLQEYSSL